MDRRRRESEGKAKIEGYMSVSDEEAHQREPKTMKVMNCKVFGVRFVGDLGSKVPLQFRECGWLDLWVVPSLNQQSCNANEAIP